MQKLTRVLALLVTLLIVVSRASAADPGPKDVAAIYGKFRKLVAQDAEADKRGYVFDPAVLHEIAKKGAGLPGPQAFDRVQKELIARYGDHITADRRWIFNDAGSALGQMTLLHCSTKEYVIFFGSPIGTGGFSGRYKHVEFWDYVLDGEMRTYMPGEFEPHVFGPGEFGYMPKGQSKGFTIAGKTWLLEYGRGNVLSAFNFGIIAPARYLSLDWKSAWEQIHDCGKLAIREIFGPHGKYAGWDAD